MTQSVSSFCLAAALSMGVMLGARAQAPNSATQASSGPWNVKVTARVAKEDNQVILTGAMVEPAGSSGAGAGAMPDSLKNATTFKLQVSGLDSHVSEKVEIMGSATAPPPSPAPASPGGPAPAPGRGRGSSTANAPLLNVKSLRTIHRYPCFADR